MRTPTRRRIANREVWTACGLIATLGCSAAPEPKADEPAAGEAITERQGALNPGLTTDDPHGHVRVTMKAIEFLRARGLLPPELESPDNQRLVLYGNDFADHPFNGRPESPSTPVVNHMLAQLPVTQQIPSNVPAQNPVPLMPAPITWGLPVAGAVGAFSFPLTVVPFVSIGTARVTIGAGLVWAPPTTERSVYLRNGFNVNVAGDILFVFDQEGGDHRDFAADNLFHYTLGDINDFGDSALVEGDAAMRLYPLFRRHVLDQFHGLTIPADNLVSRMVNQELLKGADFGATKYGAILYQLSRKFFDNSAAEPDLAELIRAGQDVPFWRTGGMQGHGDLANMSYAFPHTYLGGMPYVCAGASGGDPCATGTPVWPIWLPATRAADNPSFLRQLEVARPGRSTRAALIYLGWATHMMQDASVPHHAANWTGKEHAAQDNLGDWAGYYQLTPVQPNPDLRFCTPGVNCPGDPDSPQALFMDRYMARDVDALLGTVNEHRQAGDICRSIGIVDNQVQSGSLNWHAVQAPFLDNAKRAFYSRRESDTSGKYGAEFVKNAILGTIKLILCAKPNGSTPLASRGDVSGDGRADIVLTGGIGWRTMPVAASNGDGTFRVTNTGVADFPDYAQQAGAVPVTGDFDGDGKSDVALTAGTNWRSIPVAFSKGDGSYRVTNIGSPTFAFWAPYSPVKPVAGDFNGDGRSDIAVIGGFLPVVVIAFSNGDGTFHTKLTFLSDFGSFAAQPGAKPVAGDFNGDGRWDLALTGGAGWGSVPVAFSNGDGTFRVTNNGLSDFPGFAQQAGATPVAGDFNGDGLGDIALTSGVGWGSIPVAFSNGDGTFRVTNNGVYDFPIYAQQAGATPVAGDFNGDGRTDIALTSGVGWGSIPVAFSNSGGEFSVTNNGVNDFPIFAQQAGAKPVGGP